MQPYFRDAVGGDLPAIVAILGAASPDAERTEHLSAYREALAEIDRTDGSYVLVAEYDNRIAAVLHLLAFRHLHEHGGRSAHVAVLQVAEPFRTTGIAGMLLDHAADRARDLGCRRLQVLSSTARGDEHTFWERHGFVQFDRGYARPLA